MTADGEMLERGERTQLWSWRKDPALELDKAGFRCGSSAHWLGGA